MHWRTAFAVCRSCLLPKTMSDIEISDLYQEMIVDHSRRPRNFRRLENATHQAEGFNPLCGDKVKVYVDFDRGMVRDVSFEGEGCAISKASASLMTESIKGKSEAEVKVLFSKFRDLAIGNIDGDPIELGKLVVFAGLRGFPTRVKCATLPWHTLRAALDQNSGVVSTE
jgi:nitrogen fixation protein NifU and related proteins